MGLGFSTDKEIDSKYEGVQIACKPLPIIIKRKQNPKPERIDIESYGKVQELIKKIQLAKEKLEKSLFYAEFMEQLKDPQMDKLIKRAISTDPRYSQLQLVLYGIGKISSGYEEIDTMEKRHMQFAFAILLRERFQWVNHIVVYDPVLSAVELTAINSFSCTCLSYNEVGRRTVDRPTLFFMPRCPFFLYDNVLEANWTPSNLNKIIILGNSFKSHLNDLTYRVTKKMKVVLENGHMLLEIPLPQTDSVDPDPVYTSAFDGLSWHFFDMKPPDLGLGLDSRFSDGRPLDALNRHFGFA